MQVSELILLCLGRNINLNFYNIEVDLTQQVGDIDFSNFCIVYTGEGIINLLHAAEKASAVNSKTGAGKKYSEDSNSSSATGKGILSYEESHKKSS